MKDFIIAEARDIVTRTWDLTTQSLPIEKSWDAINVELAPAEGRIEKLGFTDRTTETVYYQTENPGGVNLQLGHNVGVFATFYNDSDRSLTVDVIGWWIDPDGVKRGEYRRTSVSVPSGGQATPASLGVELDKTGIWSAHARAEVS